MKRIELKSQTSPHFIGSWNIHNNELCKNIIHFFKDKKDTDNILFINLPNYIHGWKNTNEQHDIMLNYKLTDDAKYNIKKFTK